MTASVLLELRDGAGDAAINTSVEGWLFRESDPGSLYPWAGSSDDFGRLTVAAAAFSVGEVVWAAVGFGQLNVISGWKAHFSQHRVQDL